jgi:hypothetical protein
MAESLYKGRQAEATSPGATDPDGVKEGEVIDAEFAETR